ncbi:hypothetical protein [Niameybacter massiliensis]|uniref:hypothetical protein n=1 Tax=Niameybacter massiliensis TaxID=1658108 RepID=UPI0006B65412|nr:hypothetical protein [Niameybacter massiliensis]
MNIILTEALKSHMICHDKEFLHGWEKTLDLLQEKGTFKQLTEDVERIVTTFEEPIGYSMLLETTDQDEIVYAKRLERELYTRFVKGKAPGYSYQVMCILRKSKEVEDAYELITMYPGGKSEKEPEDTNIQTKEEMIRSLLFWKDRALIYTPSNIEPGSEKDYCPYKNLFFLLED